MKFNGRLLVGLNGHEPDPLLIRYASMVARLNSCLPLAKRAPRSNIGNSESVATANDAESGWVTEPATTSIGCEGDPEVRFVYLLPKNNGTGEPGRARIHRAAMRAHVNQYFTELPSNVSVGCDVLKGDAIFRLPLLAADFDPDLLLLDAASWPQAHCARLARESPCSVWMVPAGWAPVLRRVLVPVDFKASSAAALQTALNLVKRIPTAKCVVLYVDSYASRFSDEAIDRGRRRELQCLFDDFIRRIDTYGVPVEPMFVKSCRTGQAIARVAEQYAADLTVMATHGGSRLVRMARGSVTETVIRASTGSLLILRRHQRVGLLAALREYLCRPVDLQFC